MLKSGRSAKMLAFFPSTQKFTTRGNDDFLFSFVITTCEAKRSKSFLTETVESMLAQTIGFGKNIQIVLVNDGNTGKAGAACKHYRELWPNNIVLINQSNSSPDAARNAGLKAATGRWLNFLEPGDKWDPDACETALNFFGRHPKINVACFPITLFGINNGEHWLNYKFKKTRVANIFKDPDSAVLDLCSCFCAREAVKNRSFDEDLPISDESAWIAKLLLDEQNFAIIAKPYCRCRSTRSSAEEAVQASPSRYADSLRPNLDVLRHAKERYGEAPAWAQYTVMLNLCRRLREEDRGILTPAQKETYQELMRDCLKQIHDRIICTARNLLWEERLIALAIKHGTTYDQIREWIKPDRKEKALRFCRPGAGPVPFAKPWELWLESMDIAEGQLLLRGSCAVLTAPAERMRLVLTVESPDGGVQEYPCELLRQPNLKKRRLLWDDDFWPREGFELAMPITGQEKIRAFAEIEDLRFDLKWLHKQRSPFVRNEKRLRWERAAHAIGPLLKWLYKQTSPFVQNKGRLRWKRAGQAISPVMKWLNKQTAPFVRNEERLHWKRAGHVISPLPDDTGLSVKTGEEGRFLFSFIIPACNVKRYLADAVESVLAQSIGFRENIQIVFVNDGSTDGTGTVCRQYRDLWPENIIYLEKPHGGVSSARNAGLKAATGRYVNFLDSHDRWDPNVCQAALDFFEKHPKVNIVCFPILPFEKYENEHYLNYKFKRTKVVHIFKDTDYALNHVPSCFIRGEATRTRPFDEKAACLQDFIWLGMTLLDEQAFGAIAGPGYRYRKGFDQNPAMDTEPENLDFYLTIPSLYYLELFRYAQEKYREIPAWAQQSVMLDLSWRIKQQDKGFLTPEQKEEYRGLLRTCLARIDDRIICKARNLFIEERICTLALKYGKTYEQIKKWLSLDGKTGWLRFCRPKAPSMGITRIDSFRLEFMDIADGHLLLRGSCHVLVPRERMTFALEMELPDGSIQKYPCELHRRVHRKRHSFFEGEIWAMESFELFLPLVDGAKVQAFFSIDGIRFDLKWKHERLSSFFRGNETSYLARGGYIISSLPDDMGLYLEAWTSQRAQEREQNFLRSLAQQATDTPSALVARIRRAARKMRRMSKKPIWLISDRLPLAGDNGEAFFEYLMSSPEARRDVRPFFVLGRDSADWERLSQIGPTVAHGSMLHKVLFLAADKCISSSVNFTIRNPLGNNDFLFHDLYNFDFVFLQHGVTKDDQSRSLNKYKMNLALFVTATRREWDSIAHGEYGYAPEEVVLTGFPRHDKLIRRASAGKPQHLVAVMPTWRNSLAIGRDPRTDTPLFSSDFTQSEYFQFWNGFINHPRLLDALLKHDYRLQFAIHPYAASQVNKFNVQNPVEIVQHCDYSQAFCDAALLVTDYSSVAFDVALLKKPIIYAQFDADTFFNGSHAYEKGYFEYDQQGFGPVCNDMETTVNAVIRYLENGCEMEPMYRARVDDAFGQQSANRSQAVADAIRKLGRRPL